MDKIRIFAYIITTVFVIGAAFPHYILLVNSFKSASEILTNPVSIPFNPRLTNFIEVITHYRFHNYMLNSLKIISIALPLIIVVGLMAGYSLARLKPKGSAVIMSLLLIGLSTPAFLYIVPLYSLMRNLHLTNNLLGLVPIYTAIYSPLATFILYSIMLQLPPSIEEAARLDGASELRILVNIISPLILSSIKTVALLLFVFMWNEFLFAFVFLSSADLRTTPLAFMFFVRERGLELNSIFAAGVLSIIPVLVFYPIFRREVARGLAMVYKG